MAVGAGLPPRQIEQNVGNVAGILGFVQTGRGIGLIFFLCDAGGFGIGGTIRNRVDRRAGNIDASDKVSAWIETKRAALPSRAILTVRRE